MSLRWQCVWVVFAVVSHCDSLFTQPCAKMVRRESTAFAAEEKAQRMDCHRGQEEEEEVEDGRNGPLQSQRLPTGAAQR